MKQNNAVERKTKWRQSDVRQTAKRYESAAKFNKQEKKSRINW